MNSYLISYDLNQPGQDYKALIDEIKLFEKYCHCLESVWIVKSDSTALDIKGLLSRHIDQNDNLLVIKLSNEYATSGFSIDQDKWLNDWV